MSDTPTNQEINALHEGIQDYIGKLRNGKIEAEKQLTEALAEIERLKKALEMADELIDQLIIDNTDNYAEERATIRATIKAAKGARGIIEEGSADLEANRVIEQIDAVLQSITGGTNE